MTPILFVALWSMAAVDAPPPPILAGCESGQCPYTQTQTLSVPVTAEVRHPVAAVAGAAVGRSVGVVRGAVKVAAKPVRAIARLKPARTAIKAMARLKPARRVGSLLLCRRCR